MGWFPHQAGGLNRFYYHLVHSLPGAGVSVRGMVAGSLDVVEDSGGLVESFAPATAPIPVRWARARRFARRVLAEDNVDLVVSHFALYGLPILDLMSPRPLLVQFHGPWADESLAEGSPGWLVQLKHAVEARVYRRADRFMVLSEAFRQVLHRDYGVPLERIRVVSGGVDASAFDTGLSREAARALLGWPTDRPLVLTVRRLARRMGLENLIEAMQAVCRAVPEALLLVAGKGHLKHELEERIEALELSDNVQLLGFVADDILPVAYRAADLTVVPTVTLEGFGLITIESLAAGTPVLVTPIGGLPEAVNDLSPQLVLPGTTPPELAEGMLDALSGRLPLPSAQACQTYVRTHFDWPVIAARVRDVYLETLG
jgi:glycogen(starch) synthase